jgi:hypothetical protein
MNKRLRLAALGLLAAAATVLGLTPATGAQAATVKPASVQYYEIVNFGSRGCLDVRTEDGVFTDGARIQNYQCTGADEQKWAFVDLGNGYSQLVNKRSHKCIDGGHEWLIQWSCGDVAHHQWRLVQGSVVNEYQIQERNGNRYIELPSGNGTSGQIYATSPVSQPNWYAQLFDFHAV